MREVYLTMDAPQAKKAVITMARKGCSNQSPMLLAINGVTGSAVWLECLNVPGSKAKISAAELNKTTVPTTRSD